MFSLKSMTKLEDLTVINKYGITEFQHLKKAFVPTFFLRPITFLKFIFHAKIQLL
jgi:hypothetical protein